MPNQNVRVERSNNPLFQKKEIRPLYNWHEFLECWQATENFFWLESLLHRGFSVSLEKRDFKEKEYDNIDRFIFYFSIADGWTDCSPLDVPEDKGKKFTVGYDQNKHSIEKRPGEIRQQLARKAFDMLCVHLFKMELKDRDGKFIYNWQKEIISERLFPVIQDFFRAEKSFLENFRIRNLSHQEDQSHNEQLTVGFLLNLVKFIWEWEEPYVGHYSDSREEKKAKDRIATIRARVDSAKPWTIETLSCLGKLDLLQEWLFELDRSCLARLEEIALRNKFSHYSHPVKDDRPVVDIDEACFLGSKAGWLLKEYELKKKEDKRLQELLEAEQRKEENIRQIEKLTKK